jgi:hypothetical protein
MPIEEEVFPYQCRSRRMILLGEDRLYDLPSDFLITRNRSEAGRSRGTMSQKCRKRLLEDTKKP